MSGGPSERVAELLAALAEQGRVALVHDWLTGMRGGEKVLEAIAKLVPGAPIHTLLHVPGSAGPLLESHPIRTSFIQRVPGAAKRYRSLLPLFPAAIEDFDLTGYDLVLSTSHCVAKGIVPGPQAFHVCYCHTPMRYAWDQEHVYFPKRRGLTARLRQLALTGLRVWDAASVHRVDRFLAKSRFVAGRIRRFYGRDAEVLHPPVDVETFAADLPDMSKEHNIDGSTPSYALAVSALAPYKRVEVAVEACQRLDLELRIVGDGPERSRLEKLAGPRTRFLGRVEGEELRRLYRGASFFLQPGVEDFGIASVEALASATPVVATARGGILDIAEDGVHGVLYAERADGAEAASALAGAIDKAAEMRFNSQELVNRARTFSDTNFRERFLAILSRAVSAGEFAGMEAAIP